LSEESEQIDILKRFEDNYSYSSEVIGYQDKGFTPPADVYSTRVSIIGGRGEQISSGTPGTNTARYVGVVMIDINGPSGTGGIEHQKRCKAVADVFKKALFSNLDFDVPYRSGDITTNSMRTITVACPFTRDEQDL